MSICTELAFRLVSPIAVVALVGMASSASSQEIIESSNLLSSPNDTEELYSNLAAQFTEAQEVFNDPQRQSQSIDFFAHIIDAVEDARRSDENLAEELIELQQESLASRGRAFFNAGQLQGASDDFRQLILDNPRYTLDAESLSPKVIDFFEDQKKQLVGYIAVTTEPAGARVMVNGEFIGITNFFPIEVHTGLARVEVNLEGYESHLSEDTDVLPGEIASLDLVLARNSAKLPIITQPTGVEVVVDGEPAGLTSGRLPPDLRSFMPEEFDVERLSAPFELNALPLGKHVIELRKECYETVRFELDATEPRDYTARIMKLEDSVGRLSITSSPDNANVFLDGKSVGTTPLNLDRVCSGEHYLEVKHASGKYFEDISVGRDEALSLECPIRPSLAFLGLVAEADVAARDRRDILERMKEGLSGLSGMNLIFPERGELTSMFGDTGLEALIPTGADRAQDRRDLTRRIGKELEVEAVLFGYVPAQRLTKDVVLHFYAVEASTPDIYRVNYLDRDSLPRFVEMLSRTTPLYGNWIGLTSIDTRIIERPVVIGVNPAGPAAQAGIQPGDQIVSAAGQSVATTRELLTLVSKGKVGGAFPVIVSRQGVSQTKNIQIGRTPLEVPLNQSGFMYNQTIVDLRHRMASDPDAAPLAQLNLGLCFMQLGDYETALKEHLPQVTLSEASGVSQGTVLYHTGLAYLRLGERGEAARIFQQALEFPESTLQSNDGPRVQLLIQRHLRAMGQKQ